MKGLFALIGGTVGVFAMQLVLIFGGTRLFPPDPPREYVFPTDTDHTREVRRRHAAESALTRERAANAELTAEAAVLRERLFRANTQLRFDDDDRARLERAESELRRERAEHAETRLRLDALRRLMSPPVVPELELIPATNLPTTSEELP